MEEDLEVLQRSSGRRAAAYWFSDGLPEMVFGIALTGWGAAGFAWAYWLYWWMAVVAALAFLCFLALLVWERKILDGLKARLTYPRTGYAQPPGFGYPPRAYIVTLKTETHPSTRNSNVTAFYEGTVSIFILAFALMSFFPWRWSVTVVMCAIACLVYWARRWSEYPYSWRSMLPLALAGIPFGIFAIPQRAQSFSPILIGGVWLFSRGAWMMTQYLRINRRPVERARA